CDKDGTPADLFRLMKDYGMAGIRLGYCLSADSELLRSMSSAVQPWNVSVVAQAAGIAALREREFVDRARTTIFSEKPRLIKALTGLGFRVCPSSANYLLFYGREGMHTALREKRIAIRNCDNYHGLGPGWYRIAVKLPEENDKLIAAMAEVLNGGAK
ncbi:MAG: aminotransferase class I/II-fold pyridoxal phosphate-dependent enzyme, partial [Oscillospiraceae bacterium]|nr:aminotransferase class I/II-fold pyridoxal phosphate-dependent enzyme [Oscillospiraceae bacterium]